jgi:precorrin-6B C5,15-methyltransferase / cobalt-precorrin-6B C5,C15-methyltransferase
VTDELGPAPGLPDETFEHDGLITKRLLRAAAFAHLRPMPDQLLWDVGAGSGAVGIEWARSAPGAHAVGIERDPVRADRARRNVERLAPGLVQIVEGDAEVLLLGLASPDAVFIGGGGAVTHIVEACMAALTPSGRLVAHGVTLETERTLTDLHRALGGSLSRISIDSAEPLGRFWSWRPLRPVVQWAWVKA